MIVHVTNSLSQKMRFFFQFLGGAGWLTKKTFQETCSRPFYGSLVLEQIYLIGVSSIGLVAVTNLCIGMVMALQFGLGLEKFGGKLYVPKIVALCIVRELGPVFASLMLAARVGAGMASEIGSMKVTQQIDAIRALGTSPIKKIVIPRVIAILFALPILTVIANTVGIVGSLAVGVFELGLDPAFYLQKIYTTVEIADYAVGLIKTIFFAFFIVIPACYFGLTVKEGTRGVGQATTSAVVVASIMIVIGDFFLTKFFWVVTKWIS